jgi:hypothetical protein
MSRFNEKLDLLDDLSGEFLVHCPECDECARVAGSPDNQLPIRLTCGKCGLAKDWKCSQPGVRMWAKDKALFKKGVISIGDSVDWCFHLPLWIKAPCCGHELWAYNYDHLSWLKNYIGAKIRERREDEEFGWRNQSLASRLPLWMKDGKNRTPILETIKRLEQKRA